MEDRSRELMDRLIFSKEELDQLSETELVAVAFSYMLLGMQLKPKMREMKVKNDTEQVAEANANKTVAKFSEDWKNEEKA